MVIISPSDVDLIIEGSETRRKFIDSVISILDNSYLNELIQYQKLVAQRNALLKYFAVNHVFDTIVNSIVSLCDRLFSLKRSTSAGAGYNASGIWRPALLSPLSLFRHGF